ncbi:ribosomal RNA small subunit methyltransferase D [Tetragenococcus muriaticus PMC-11-5]|uniref:Ribosomal RNA small subunit methyltransferase D n=1 Tax=Tetragenococcus muriaticus PMC-11-5 TaxID=1302649 RepID=A0A091C093_9ENTE|nr:ribosomal RNA small subunit methyltransferase D [Tetragenococcus muriaticus PMC-11-5]
MRVISGNYRKMALKSLSKDTTRPTTDKIKEALFNMIGPYFNGEQVLDLYSGSGALAIEAVSRGARSAVCVEKYYPALKVIQENIDLTKEEHKFITLKQSAQKALFQLANDNQTFDLGFFRSAVCQTNYFTRHSTIIKFRFIKKWEPNSL